MLMIKIQTACRKFTLLLPDNHNRFAPNRACQGRARFPAESLPNLWGVNPGEANLVLLFTRLNNDCVAIRDAHDDAAKIGAESRN